MIDYMIKSNGLRLLVDEIRDEQYSYILLRDGNYIGSIWKNDSLLEYENIADGTIVLNVTNI